ncbi:MAG: glycosyltransferase family 2 protein [Nocardioides sp.]|nr:glycosyltransferase family 2 protein [Nocardioides sp.]
MRALRRRPKNQVDWPDDDAVTTSLPTVAVITMVRDEATALPRWIAHYSAQVGMENLVVLDDNSSDGSTDDLPCTVHRLPALPGRKGYETARMGLLSGIASGLLAVYDWVVMVDADEFLVADPASYSSVPELLARRAGGAIAPMALNVVHHTESEKPLDPDLPLLDQRHYATFVPLMCKPSVKRVAAPWRHASHGIAAPFAVDSELFMLHLKFADRDQLKVISDRRSEMVSIDGRAAKSSWSRSGDDMVALLEEVSARIDPVTLTEFDPTAADLASVVFEESPGEFRTRKQGQVRAMREEPVHLIPTRLRGLI